MTLRPGRPVIPAKRCNFEKCPSTRARDVNFTGSHPRALCETHEEQVRVALEQHRDAVIVTWGRSADEKRALDQDRAAALVEQYGEPNWPDDSDRDPFSWSADETEDQDEDDERPWPSMQQEEAWYVIEDLRNRDYAGYYPTDDLPVVRIKVRNR
jgi:hypothetical protein